MVKDYSWITFPIMLGTASYVFQIEKRYIYQLAAIISHLGHRESDQGHHRTVVRIFGRWIQFTGAEIEAIGESSALQKASQKQRDTFKLALPCSIWQTTE
jgi:hypothetical protein